MQTYTYTKEIPQRIKTDIFVAGGGPAGVAAAVAAAREGAEVFLAEAQGSFGGAGTTSLVPAFMPFGNGVDFLAEGIGREIYDKIIEMGAVHKGRFSDVGIHAEHLKKIYDDIVMQAGVQFAFYTRLIDVITEDRKITKAVLSAKSGIFTVEAKIYIDCTGDGDLSVWAGADYEMGDENGSTMPATLCSLWAGIDWQRVSGHDNRALESAFQDQVFSVKDRHLPGMWQLSEIFGGGNLGHEFNVNATDERSLTEAMINGRKRMTEYEEYYKKYLTGYEKMELAATGSYLGVRESRRIVCDYMLTGKDFFRRASFEDEIGRFSYPIDIHIMTPEEESFKVFKYEHFDLRYKDGESYGIPYRSLIPTKLDNAFVAGRCAGADRQMQSSIRVMPCCYIMGQAAGTAAAMSVSEQCIPRDIKVEALRDRLREAGAFLPDVLDSGEQACTLKKCSQS